MHSYEIIFSSRNVPDGFHGRMVNSRELEFSERRGEEEFFFFKQHLLKFSTEKRGRRSEYQCLLRFET